MYILYIGIGQKRSSNEANLILKQNKAKKLRKNYCMHQHHDNAVFFLSINCWQKETENADPPHCHCMHLHKFIYIIGL